MKMRIEVAPEAKGSVATFPSGLRGHRRPTLSELQESLVIPGYEWTVDAEGFAVMTPADQPDEAD